MSQSQTIKTLIHEMTHQKLHASPTSANSPTPSRSSEEVEAESVAYTVCHHLGIDTSDYSLGYIAAWSRDKSLPELKASMQRIRTAASELIRDIDEKVALLERPKDWEPEKGGESHDLQR